MAIIHRLKAAHQRLACATRFTRSYLASVLGFIRYKFNKTKTMFGNFEGIAFMFRSADVEALKEVLVDQEYNFLSEYLKNIENPVILDLGHHIGTFSLWVFSQNEKAEIVGLEADPETFSIAQQNAILGQNKGYHWSVLNRAAWKNEEAVSFSTAGDTMGHKVKEGGNISVQGISFKAFLDQIDKPVNLMKIDIEGAEEAFLSAHPDLLQKIDALVIEIHPEYCSEKNVRDIIENAFDTITPLHQRETDKPLLWCRNKI